MSADAGKPTAAGLGVELAVLRWQRSGEGDGSIEVAFVAEGGGAGGGIPDEWVLMRVVEDPQDRVLVYDRNEWECFLDGVRGGEFDDAAS